MNKPVVTPAVTILSAVACGATFLFALARQFAVLAIAASIVTGVQLYLLSSTVGDLIAGRRKEEKVAASLMLRVVAAFLAVFTNSSPTQRRKRCSIKQLRQQNLAWQLRS